MSRVLSGIPAAKALEKETADLVTGLWEKGHKTVLGLLRVGERGDDVVYEHRIRSGCTRVGIAIDSRVLPLTSDTETVLAEIERMNEDPKIDGIMMFCPLPKHLDEHRIRNAVLPEKDVDALTDVSLSSVFLSGGRGFSPCTAQAVMELLRYYDIPVAGKNVLVMGRSYVIGRPVAMLLLKADATVTISHTKSENVPELAKKADILVTAVGHARCVDKRYFHPGLVVIDVGTNWSASEQKLLGDINEDEAEPLVEAYSPVPGGVGNITSAVLLHHVAEAAMKQQKC